MYSDHFPRYLLINALPQTGGVTSWIEWTSVLPAILVTFCHFWKSTQNSAVEHHGVSVCEFLRYICIFQRCVFCSVV